MMDYVVRHRLEQLAEVANPDKRYEHSIVRIMGFLAKAILDLEDRLATIERDHSPIGDEGEWRGRPH